MFAASIYVPDNLPHLFLPYGQVEVGINGLEVAIYSFQSYLPGHKDNPDLHAVKLDMHNTFNEVQRASYLCQLEYHCITFLEYTPA